MCFRLQGTRRPTLNKNNLGRYVKHESAFEKKKRNLACNHTAAAKQGMKRKSKVSSAGHSDSPPRRMRVELACPGKAPTAKNCTQNNAKGPILLNLLQER